MKMSGFVAGKKSGAPSPAPAAADHRRLQNTDCEALIAEVDSLCLADVCSSECAIKLYEASSNGMTAVSAGGCQSHTLAYDLSAASTFLITAGYTYSGGWTTFQVGAAQMITVKSAANCVPPCEAEPCDHGAVCAAIKTAGIGFTGFTCDCAAPETLGWSGHTCQNSCMHGKVDRTEAIASIDHTIHTVTIAAENTGMHTGMVLTLTSAPGRTCTSAVADANGDGTIDAAERQASQLTVSGIAAGTQIQFSAGSIVTTDTDADLNCILLLECTPCEDGEEPDSSYTTCLPCRPGTFGVTGVCDPCTPGSQPKVEPSCVDVCAVQTSLITCNVKTNAGAQCLWGNAACTGTDATGTACVLNGASTACAVETGTCTYTGTCTKDPIVTTPDPCPAADVSPSQGTIAAMTTLCELGTGIGHCHYLASLASCEACPDLNAGSGLASYSTVGICEACPLGMRPNAARSACVFLLDLYANPPVDAIFPRTVVTYASTATFVGDFAPLLVGPVLEGVSQISAATIEAETIIGDLEQNSLFSMSFDSTDQLDGPMSGTFLNTANGAAFLAQTLAWTLTVSPEEIRVMQVDIYGEDAFVPPLSGLAAPVLDPSPVVTTVTLAGDIASIGQAGSSTYAAFVRDVVNAIALVAAIAPSRITVLEIRAASIELVLSIADDATDLNQGEDGNAKTADAAMLSLYQAAVNGDLEVSGYPVIGANQAYYGRCEPVATCPGTDATGAPCALNFDSTACVVETGTCQWSGFELVCIDHDCVPVGLESCPSTGACVPDFSHCPDDYSFTGRRLQEEAASARRRMQALTPVTVDFEVNSTGTNIVPLLNDPNLGAKFEEVMLNGPGMDLVVVFTGNCHSLSFRDYTLPSSDGAVAVTCSPSVVCMHVTDCVYDKHASKTLPDSLTPLGFESGSTVRPYVQPLASSVFDINTAFAVVDVSCEGMDDGTGTACTLNSDSTACAVQGGICVYTKAMDGIPPASDATATQTALEKCMTMCIDHAECTAFTHRPCDDPPCSTSPDNNRGCRFYAGAAVDCVPEVTPLGTCIRPAAQCAEMAGTPVAADTANCAAVSALTDNMACDLVMLDCGSTLSGSCAAGCTDPGSAGQPCTGLSTAPACTYTGSWCSEVGRTYTQGDCDGDGEADHLCVLDAAPGTSRGTLLSASGCTDNWPSAPLATACPRTVLPATGYAKLASLAAVGGAQTVSGATNAGVTWSECTFLCDAQSDCNSFDFNPADNSCILMDKVTTASDALATTVAAAGHVTYYKEANCIAGVAEVPNIDLEAAVILEVRADPNHASFEDASYDTDFYALKNYWTPDITLQRKQFTVASAGLALLGVSGQSGAPQITTVMPYEVKATMNGEDSAGVAAAADLMANGTMLGTILDISGAINNAGNRVMELTAVESVTTSEQIGCQARQWSRDPFCYACTVCQPGEARISECSAYADTVCQKCPHETYSLYGIECLACTAPCNGGVEFEHTECNGITNRVCGSCGAGAVAVRLCSHKDLTRSFRSRVDHDSTGRRPRDDAQGVFECPWTCIGGDEPKLHRNEGSPPLRYQAGMDATGYDISATPAHRVRGGGVQAWVCRGREAQGQMMDGRRSLGRTCAPQKSVASRSFSSEGTHPTSHAVQVAELATDGDTVNSCSCIESAPTAWWGTKLRHGHTVNPALYIYARGDCCANAVVIAAVAEDCTATDTNVVADVMTCDSVTNDGNVATCTGTGACTYTAAVAAVNEAAQAMTVYIGDTEDFSAATQCGSFDPAGRSGAVIGQVECIGSGRYVFIAAANGKLSLTEARVYDILNHDVGIGHPREYMDRKYRDAEYVNDPAKEDGATLLDGKGAWIDDSINGISSRIGTYALGVTPHAPFYARFPDEFMATGEEHVSQMSYLVGDEYYDGAGGDATGPEGTAGTPDRVYGGSSGLIDDGIAVPFNNRRVYVGTHLSSGDGTLLLESVTGGLDRLVDGLGTENLVTSNGRTSADGGQDDDGTDTYHAVGEGLSTGGEGGGRTSRYWTMGREDSTHGSLAEEHWTGMTLGNVEILDDYTINNPFQAPGEECILRDDLYLNGSPLYDCDAHAGYIAGTIETPGTGCPCSLKKCGDGLNDRDAAGVLCRLNDDMTACAVADGGCSFTPCECTFKHALPDSDGPMLAGQAYYASQGQRPDESFITKESPWIYVEQWGWAQDRSWFAKNVRRGPLSDGPRTDWTTLPVGGGRRRQQEQEARDAGLQNQNQNQTEPHEIAFEGGGGAGAAAAAEAR